MIIQQSFNAININITLVRRLKINNQLHIMSNTTKWKANASTKMASQMRVKNCRFISQIGNNNICMTIFI